MCLSERHFARVFKQETGTGPGACVEAARIEVARRLLETTDRPLDQVAAAAGLGSVETLHRAFRRQLATTPAACRRRFRTQAVRAVPAPSGVTTHASRSSAGPRPRPPGRRVAGRRTGGTSP
ncbi:helix-turn-helix domain-containing protein [Streptomyces sp. NPDC101194]|uniref:helix-turn-helix domain-containing protein n=1 Tax=Streptomyces sp. NPDC101194 TaxID=3366127 RepID=UPI003830435F